MANSNGYENAGNELGHMKRTILNVAKKKILPCICAYSYNNNRWLDALQVYINILEKNEFAGINQGP